jgi:hypothetical protein
MSHSFPSHKGRSLCPRYNVGGKMSDKNLEQQTNIKFCVKTAIIYIGLRWTQYEEIKYLWTAYAVEARARLKWSNKSFCCDCRYT